MKIRYSILFIGIAYWLFETAHFGWNLLPQSDAEIICDGISLLILAFAIVPLKIVIDKNTNHIHLDRNDIRAVLDEFEAQKQDYEQ